MAILMLVGVAVFTVAVMTTVATIASRQSQAVNAALATERTFYAAEAALNQLLYGLISDSTPHPTPFAVSVPIPGVTVTATVTASGFQRTVSVIAQDTTQKVRTLEVRVNTSSFAGGFVYGAQTDVGGIKMESSDSTINGDIYSNGDVTGSGTINGDVTVADDSTLDQQDANRGSPGDELAFGQAVTTGKAAQQFTVGTSGTINHIAVLLRAVGSPDPTTLAWQITNDNSGKPATILASGLFRSVDAHPALTWVYVHVPTPVAVTAGQKYWLVIDPVVNAAKYWTWGSDTANAYSGGVADLWNSTTSTWSSLGTDLNFKTWLGSAYTSLTNVTVSGNASADNISASKVCGDASYFTITSTTQSFLNTPTDPPCSPPFVPTLTLGTGTATDDLPKHKVLPITAVDISKWQSDVQSACGAGCWGTSFSVSTNLGLTGDTAPGGALAPDTHYYYRVAAVVAGVETITSSEYQAPKTSNSKKTVTLQWSKVGASSYHIYRTLTSGMYTSPAIMSSPTITCGGTTCTFSDNGSVALTSGTTTCPDTCLGWQKINGNLNVDGNLTLTGNVWVTGSGLPNNISVAVDNNMTIKIDSGLSTKSYLLLTDQKVSTGNNASLCGSNCTAADPTNFLLVVSSDNDTDTNCTFSSGLPSIQAANNSTSVIFAAPFGALDVKKGTINAGAARSLCLETQATVNFLSAISSLFVPSQTTQPLSSVANSWKEQ